MSDVGLGLPARADDLAMSSVRRHFVEGGAAGGEADFKRVGDAEVTLGAEVANKAGAGKPDAHNALLPGCPALADKSQIAASVTVYRMEVEDADARHPALLKTDACVGEERPKYLSDFIAVGNGLGGTLFRLAK